MSNWQDISQAPKDGTVVDLWHVSGNRMADCYWYKGYFYHRGFGTSYSEDKFTHFKHITGPDDV